MDWANVLASDVGRDSDVRSVISTTLSHVKRLFHCSLGGFVSRAWKPNEDGDIYFGLRETHAQEYLVRWRNDDPVLKSALARSVAVRNSDLFDSAGTRRLAFCADYGRRVGAGPYMVVPLYGYNGSVMGTLHLCRVIGAPDFTLTDVLQALSFSGFASAMVARASSSERAVPAQRLAPREYEVAMLAARGLSNPMIARDLGLARETVKQTLRRVYTKLDIQNRTELAALCARFGWL